MFNTLFARRIWNPYIKKGGINKHSCNLPRHLQQALKELHSNKNYVIKRADKGSQAVIWSGLTSTIPFTTYITKLGPLQLTSSVGTSARFLDLEVFVKGPKIVTRFYRKESTSMKRGMIFDEALRISRNCDEDVDFEKCMCDLTSTLVGRGYESRTILKQINRAIPFHPPLTGLRKDIETMSRDVNNLLSMVGTRIKYRVLFTIPVKLSHSLTRSRLSRKLPSPLSGLSDCNYTPSKNFLDTKLLTMEDEIFDESMEYGDPMVEFEVDESYETDGRNNPEHIVGENEVSTTMVEILDKVETSTVLDHPSIL
ncbi:hypothetical protein GJ496_004566 [Pomphorhynchus laevis]|nr:hypothetical protein GJ496_004566 [Pomphorhynchus laevis]